MARVGPAATVRDLFPKDKRAIDSACSGPDEPFALCMVSATTDEKSCTCRATAPSRPTSTPLPSVTALPMPTHLPKDALTIGHLGGEHNRREIDGSRSRPVPSTVVRPKADAWKNRDRTATALLTLMPKERLASTIIECDTVRYCQVEIDAAEIAAVGSIQNLIGERIGRLHHESSGRHLIIGWDISLTSGETLHTIGDAEDLLQLGPPRVRPRCAGCLDSQSDGSTATRLPARLAGRRNDPGRFLASRR